VNEQGGYGDSVQERKAKQRAAPTGKVTYPTLELKKDKNLQYYEYVYDHEAFQQDCYQRAPKMDQPLAVLPQTYKVQSDHKDAHTRIDHTDG